MTDAALETTNPPVNVGPTKFGNTGQVYVGRYADGMLALVLLDPETGEQLLCATVCMADTATYTSKRHVWLKVWSENEGIEEALVKAGVLTLTGRTTPAGFVSAYEGKLTDDFTKALPEVVRNYIGEI